MKGQNYYNPAGDLEINSAEMVPVDFSEENFFRYRFAKDNFGDQAYRIESGKWSPIRTIKSAYVRDGLYNVNLSRGSFSNLTEKQIKEHFIFYL